MKKKSKKIKIILEIFSVFIFLLLLFFFFSLQKKSTRRKKKSILKKKKKCLSQRQNGEAQATLLQFVE